MTEMSDEQFELEKKKFTRYHNILEILIIFYFKTSVFSTM